MHFEADTHETPVNSVPAADSTAGSGCTDHLDPLNHSATAPPSRLVDAPTASQPEVTTHDTDASDTGAGSTTAPAGGTVVHDAARAVVVLTTSATIVDTRASNRATFPPPVSCGDISPVVG
jgi:hypothetical protein